VLPDRWGSIAFGWPSESLPIAAVCDPLARTCKIFRNTRPRLALNDHGAGQPTPIFRGRLRYAVVGAGLSRRRACALFSVARSTLGYQSRLAVRDVPAIAAMRTLAGEYTRYGIGGSGSS
jgi:hypothetical protein